MARVDGVELALLERLVGVLLGRVRPRDGAAEGEVLRAAGRRGERGGFIRSILKVLSYPVPSARAVIFQTLGGLPDDDCAVG